MFKRDLNESLNMSVNNVKLNNAAELAKLLKSMQAGSSAKTSKKSVDPRMTMNGSVFDKTANVVSAQKTITPQTPQGVSNNVRLNTTASLSGMQKMSAPASAVPSAETTEAGQSSNNRNEVNNNIFNYDYDNLTNVADGDLNNLYNELKDISEGDIPRHLETSIKSKLNKVQAEMQKRTSGAPADDNKTQNPTTTGNTDSAGGSAPASFGIGIGGALAATSASKQATTKSTQQKQTMEQTKSEMDAQTAQGQKEIKQNKAKMKKLEKQQKKALKKQKAQEAKIQREQPR